jgi:dipeptidyl aminopeptidase/acylaminoacyl peptidase
VKKTISLAMVLAAAIFGWGFWVFGNNKSPISTLVINSPKQINPLHIAAVRERKFENVKIDIGEVTLEKDAFTARKISYNSDGLKLYALMAVPKGAVPEKGWPVVVVNHGHIEPAKYSTENSYINTTGYFAGSGFVVLKPDFRGHGQSEGKADTLQARMEYGIDVLNLLSGIQSLPVKTDPSRIYMWGHSMGGDVTLRVLETSNSVKAASLWAPAVTTFPESVFYFARRNDAEWQKRLNDELSKMFVEDDYKKISTLENVNLVQAPLNIHTSSEDTIVPKAWSDTLTARLKDAGATVNYYIYPGTSHDIAQAWSTALNRDVELFQQGQSKKN